MVIGGQPTNKIADLQWCQNGLWEMLCCSKSNCQVKKNLLLQRINTDN